jgi:hypothetical protein
LSLDNTPLDNIVVFPTAGHKIDLSNLEVHDDPLEELLHEFDHIGDIEDDEWIDLNDEACDNVGETTVEMVLKDLFKQEQSVAQMVSQLHEVQKRTQYYMNEIETFLPKSKS